MWEEESIWYDEPEVPSLLEVLSTLFYELDIEVAILPVLVWWVANDNVELHF